MHLRNLQETDPFKGTQEEKVYLEDVADDLDDNYTDADIMVD